MYNVCYRLCCSSKMRLELHKNIHPKQGTTMFVLLNHQDAVVQPFVVVCQFPVALPNVALHQGRHSCHCFLRYFCLLITATHACLPLQQNSTLLIMHHANNIISRITSTCSLCGWLPRQRVPVSRMDRRHLRDRPAFPQSEWPGSHH